MKEINIREYFSFSETLDWINGQWVYEPPTLLKIFTAENERGKYFELDENLGIKSIIKTKTNDPVPDIGTFFLLLERDFSLDINDFALNLNKILDNGYTYDISQEDNLSTYLIRFLDSDKRVIEIHFSSFKGILTAVLYDISINDRCQDIENFLIEYN